MTDTVFYPAVCALCAVSAPDDIDETNTSTKWTEEEIMWGEGRFSAGVFRRIDQTGIVLALSRHNSNEIAERRIQ